MQAAEVVDLTPDDQSADAQTHFVQAQKAMRRQHWNVARAELERTLTLAETFRYMHADAPQRATHFANFQKYHEAYLRLLMRALAVRGQGTRPSADVISAWESHDRMQWRQWRQSLGRLAGRVTEIAPVEAASNGLLSQVQSQLLDERTLLFEFALGESESYLWVVSTQALKAYVLPQRKVIERAADELYRAASVAEASSSAALVAAKITQLQRIILAPWLNDAPDVLTSRHKALVVADGVLQKIPFNLLLTQAQEVTHVTAAKVLLEKRASAKARGLEESNGVAVLADPVFNRHDARLADAKSGAEIWPDNQSRDWEGAQRVVTRDVRHQAAFASIAQVTRLPFTRREAAQVTSWFTPLTSLQALGFAANRELAMSGRLARYPLIHFATHGYASTEQPEQSGLVLSQINERGEKQAGILRLPDICRLHLAAELIVLSACESSLRNSTATQNAPSLADGFLYAGARRVLGTLWQVDDAATAEFMRHFYAGLMGERLSPAAALMRAQSQLSQDPRWQSPYYWAGFVLQGEE